MKRCPTCDKTFEDSMKFCQLDGTTLVVDEPAFDPYATMVSSPANPITVPPIEKTEPAHEAKVTAPPDEVAETPISDKTVGSIAIPPPDDVLDLPEADPLKTMYASDTEMEQILGGVEPIAEEPAEVEEPPEPQPPSFIASATSEPSYGEPAPPPSPFSTPGNVVESAPKPPSFEQPAPAEPEYDEPATMIQPNVDVPFVPPAPVAEWTPPPVPDASWQNQEIGSNTPFQPPPAGVAGQNKTLPIISLVLGIVSLCCYVSPLTGIAAVVTGFLGMKNANNMPDAYSGKGLAIAGMITGGVFFVIGLVYWIFILFFGGLAMIMDATK